MSLPVQGETTAAQRLAIFNDWRTTSNISPAKNMIATSSTGDVVVSAQKDLRSYRDARGIQNPRDNGFAPSIRRR